MWTTGYQKALKGCQEALTQAEMQAKAYRSLLKTYSEMAWMLLTNKPKKESEQDAKQN